MSVTLLQPGLLTTVQDLGRHGHMALGVGHSGAMDVPVLRLANALVGNAADAAALELSLLGPTLRFEVATLIAVAGAEFDLHLDGQPLAAWRPQPIAAGSVLACGPARRGVRACLAVAGGVRVAPVLGSRASDIHAGLGPFGGRPLVAGDVLPIEPRPGGATMPWSLDPRPWFDPDPAQPIRLVPGSHFDRLDAAARKALFSATFRIAPASNRTGLRLDGPRLALATPLEPVSEPVAFGTLQLPPGGQPIVLMAEHPTTGGYPRIGQVAAIDLPRLAQRRPGDGVRFAAITTAEAQTRYLERERALAGLLDALARRLAT